MQGYFRDVSRDDLADILPSFVNPLDDPIFRIPSMGRRFTLNDDEEAAFRSSASHLHLSSRPLQHSLLKDRVSELKAQAAAEVNHQLTAFLALLDVH